MRRKRTGHPSSVLKRVLIQLRELTLCAYQTSRKASMLLSRLGGRSITRIHARYAVDGQAMAMNIRVVRL